MNKKTLTEVPMGKIKSFIEENFKHINFSNAAKEFFDNEFLGSKEIQDELLKIKDGLPADVTQWLKNEFGIEMALDGDYAIASVLALLLEWENKAEYREVNVDNNKMAGGYFERMPSYAHTKNGSRLFKIKTKDENYSVFVSKDKVDTSLFESKSKFYTNFLKQKDVHLTIPLVKYEEQIDLTETFKGSTMIRNNSAFEISAAKTLTLLDLNLSKVEVKQVAAVMMVVASLSPADFTERVVINDDYYMYIQYKDQLVFASKMLKEDFIKDEDYKKENPTDERTLSEQFKDLIS